MPTNLEPIRERALSWVLPISAEAPTGASAKQLPAYEAVVQEIAKLQSPSAASSVDWQRVVESGRAVLAKNSKDLPIATYVSVGLFATAGMEGLLEGTTALGALMERYWPTLFPELARTRARVNALSWFVERVSAMISGGAWGSADRELLLALQGAAERLSELSREKLAAESPGFGPLLKAIEELVLSAPAPASTAPASTGTSSPAPPPPAPMPGTGALSDADNATAYLREVGGALANAGLLLRQANPADPRAYRLLRTGLWLHLDDLSAGPDGKTALPPLPSEKRTQLEAMASHAKWAELLEESESMLPAQRFNLDLQRHSARALEMLGTAYQAARDAVLAELVGWTRRMPRVVSLLAQDGTPLADSETRAWLERDVLGGGAPQGSTRQEPAPDPDQELVTQAQQLASSGKIREAIRLVEARIEATGAARARFMLRLFLARLCAATGQPEAARALYHALDEQSLQHQLALWDPALAASCLEGLLRCVRAGRPGGALPPEYSSHFQRLCHLSLTVALSTQG